MNKISVIGIGFRPLEKKAAELVIGADVVLVNSRLLDVFKTYTEYAAVADKIIVHPDVYETLDYIKDHYKEKRLVLLAAGDPMFFGIGRLVVERFGRDSVEVFPDLSSIQVAFSRIRETSNNALLISLHGGPDPSKRRRLEHEITELPGLLQQHGKMAILTDKVNSPEKIAGVISIFHPLCRMYVCERLGYPDEKIYEGTPAEIANGSFAHPNIVIIVRNPESQISNIQSSATVFGLKEDEIAHSKGLITKDEVRAVTLHKLRLPQTGVLWDIGAGSGSVSIEAARLCPGLKVYAIEKNIDLINLINGNKEKFHTMNIEVINREAAEAVKELPAPDRVFIGGSGGRLGDIVAAAGEKMVSGIIVINGATIETLNEAVQCLEKENFNVEITEVSISRSKLIVGKRHMSALNPIFIIKGERR